VSSKYPVIQKSRMVSRCLWAAERMKGTSKIQAGKANWCLEKWLVRQGGWARATLSVFSLGSFHVSSFTHSLTPACLQCRCVTTGLTCRSTWE
jgi:hypothetical protein